MRMTSQFTERFLGHAVMKNSENKGKGQGMLISLCLLVMLLWGSLFPCIKLGYRAFGTDTSSVPSLILFAGIRFLICGTALAVISLLTGRKMIPRKEDVGLSIAASLTSIVFHYTCTYVGLTMAESGKTAILKQLCAILFVCFSALFRKIGSSRIRTFFGAVIGFIGIFAINYDSGISFGLGETLIVAASVCTVVSNLFGKRVLETMDPIAYTAFTQLFGGIILTAAGILLGGRIGSWSPRAALILGYICTASTVAYTLWFYAVRRVDLSYLFIVKMAEPLFAVLFGAILLGENLWQMRYLVSLLCIGGAIWLSTELHNTDSKNKENEGGETA